MTSVFGPKLVNDFRFSYSYFRNRLFPPTKEVCEGLAGDPRYCFGVGGTLISLFGGLSIGNNANVPQDRHPRTYQFTDNISKTIGSHRMKFGGNLEHTFSAGSWSRNFAGTFATFSPTTVAAANPTLYAALPASLKAGYTGPVATFAELLQLPVTGSLTIGIGDPGSPVKQNFDSLARTNMIRFYYQDGWQIKPRLTINYGVGWSWESNIVFHDNDRPQYLAPLGIKLGKIPQGFNNFDPALGFAWAMNDKTVIRGSASIHHTSSNRNYLRLQDHILTGAAGIGLTSASSAAVPNPKFGQAGQPATLTFNASTPVNYTAQELINYLPTLRTFLEANSKYNGSDPSIRNIELRKQAPTYLTEAIFDADFRTPYTIHINAGIQRQLTKTLSFSADYVMRRGVKFGANEGYMDDRNRWNRFSSYSILGVETPPIAGVTAGTANPVRNPVLPVCTAAQAIDAKAQCSTGIIYYGSPSILSRYQALQVKVDKRFSQGFMLTGAYALQRYRTYAPLNGATPNSFTDSAQNFGVSGASPKQQFTFSGIWELPKLTQGGRGLKAFANGWQLSTLWQMTSRSINTVQVGTFDTDGDGAFAFLLPGAQINSFGRGQSAYDISKLIDAYNTKYAAPQTALLAQIDRANRDSTGAAYPYIVLPDKFASGDSFLTHDLRVTRTISLKEKAKLTLIAEGFNIFNIANLTGYTGSLASAAYIRPTATVAGRNNPNNLFGQPTSRVSPIFGTGGPRAFQLAARFSF